MASAALVPAETSCSTPQPLRAAMGSRDIILHRTRAPVTSIPHPSTVTLTTRRFLPRHQYGSLQGTVFQAYFMLKSMCSAISVAAFAYLHPWKTASTTEGYQLGFLIAALGCDLSNLLVFTPMSIKMMMKKYKMEKNLGMGIEVGYSKSADMAKTNPALAAMNRKFGMIHGFSSLASAMSFGSLAIHSWYLARKSTCEAMAEGFTMFWVMLLF